MTEARALEQWLPVARARAHRPQLCLSVIPFLTPTPPHPHMPWPCPADANHPPCALLLYPTHISLLQDGAIATYRCSTRDAGKVAGGAPQ